MSNREIKQIVVGSDDEEDTLYALCEDNTIWHRSVFQSAGEWERVPSIPKDMGDGISGVRVAFSEVKLFERFEDELESTFIKVSSSDALNYRYDHRTVTFSEGEMVCLI